MHGDICRSCLHHQQLLNKYCLHHQLFTPDIRTQEGSQIEKFSPSVQACGIDPHCHSCERCISSSNAVPQAGMASRVRVVCGTIGDVLLEYVSAVYSTIVQQKEQQG